MDRSSTIEVMIAFLSAILAYCRAFFVPRHLDHRGVGYGGVVASCGIRSVCWSRLRQA
jgi:hypothetical protein